MSAYFPPLTDAETLRHHRLRKQGFHEEAKQSSGAFAPFYAQVKDFRAGVNAIGLGILRRFQNPTIFLKISCEGDFLLPVVVGTLSDHMQLLLLFNLIVIWKHITMTFAYCKLCHDAGEFAVENLIDSSDEDFPGVIRVSN